MTVRAIIADDEPLSVEMIRVLLEELDGGIEIVATCSSGEETLARVAELRPDLLLLDVNMPQLDGMSVATALAKDDGYKPHIVFTTAHAEFAAQAFDVDAVDYLLKPITPARLSRAIERVRSSKGEAPKARVIPVPVLGGVELLELENVEWAEARRDYVNLFCVGRSYVVRKTLSAFAKGTYPELRQCHRSFLVNLRFIRRVVPKPRGEAVLCFSSGKEVPVSRGYKALLGDLGVFGDS
jgi:DNA-binding LytR/AlgR family response regulator